MNSKPELIGLGEVCVDLVSQVPYFPEPDEKLDAFTQDFFMGGVTANFLTAASKLGINTGFIGAVGDDSYGDFLLSGLKKARIDTTLMKKNGHSPINIITVARNSGEKTIVQSPYLQTTKLEPEDIKEEYFSNARALHTTAIHEDLAIKCLEISRKKGIVTSLDLEKQIAIRGLNALKPIIENIDILLPNKEGAKTLTGKQDLKKCAQALLDLGPDVVIITLGKEGALVTTRKMQKIIPTHDVNVVDTTGAGDAFCAAFISAHVIKKMSIEDSARFANAVAAIKIQHLGATGGLPTWEQALKFQKNHHIS
ncbi:MAG: carbohydrate kinase family protein [Promethearchaeota archaeon]